jgi:hypothetical protein
VFVFLLQSPWRAVLPEKANDLADSDATAVQTPLVRLGRIDPFETDWGRADGERMAVNDPWRAREVLGSRSRAEEQPCRG